jgi:hypothetical protein
LGTAAKKPKLSPTQAKVVKAKVKAELTDTSQAAVATAVYPNASPASASVMMSRELKKVNVQEALEIAMAEYGLTADTLASTVGDAMLATKPTVIEGKLVESDIPDHGVRIRAATLAGQWMGVGKNNGEPSTQLHFHSHQSGQQEKYGL